jgi:hypothetical protein
MTTIALPCEIWELIMTEQQPEQPIETDGAQDRTVIIETDDDGHETIYEEDVVIKE